MNKPGIRYFRIPYFPGLLLALGLFSAALPAAPVNNDIGLEEREAHWEFQGGARWTSESPHSGKTAVDLSRAKSDPPRIILTEPLDWIAHSVYRTTFWARTTDGTGLVKVNFWGPVDEEGKTCDTAHREVKVPADGRWHKFKVVHEITEAKPGRDIRLRVWTPYAAVQKTFVDDIELVLLRTNKVYLKKDTLICLSENDANHAAEPRIAIDQNGDVWVTWIGYGLQSDTISMCRIDRGGKTASPVIRIPAGEACESPRIAACGRNVIVSWLEITPQGEWMVRSSRWNGKGFSPPETIWSGGRKAHNPFLTSSPDGTAWLVWEAYGELSSRIFLSRFRDGTWSRPVGVTNPASRCYDPSIAVDPETDDAWIAYSRSDRGYSDVWLTRMSASDLKVRQRFRLTESGWAFYPRLAIDGNHDLWITWEEQVGAVQPSRGTATIGEIFDKVIHAAWLRKDGLHRLTDSESSEIVSISTEGNSQRPALLARADGGVLLLNRVSEESRRTWNITATLIDTDDGKVSEPVKALLGVELGRKDDCAAVPFRDTLHLVWQGDDYLTRRFGEVRSDVYLAEMALSAITQDASWRPVEWKPWKAREEKRPQITPKDHVRKTVVVGGEKYTLYWGTLHEHTDYSRCAKGYDGSQDDNYRLNIDIEEYDFATMTDHGYDLDRIGWKKTKRVASFYNQPGYFVTFPAYEWTQTPAHNPVTEGYGHRNVIFASDEDAGEFCYNCFMEESDHIAELWDLLRGRNVITIPHHPADRVHPMDWCRDDELQPLVEIFQSRGSAEHAGAPRVTRNLTDRPGCFVHDALKRGFHLGIVASGDHVGPGSTAVYAKSLTRKDILDALRDRRCYGTTEERIFVDFRANDHMMGEEFTTSPGDEIQITARVQGTDKLKEVVVFRNCEVFYRINEEELQRKDAIRISLSDEVNQDTHYYLRVVQQSDEIAWSSPIWISVN
jgi:hypothetical protein